MKKSVYLRLISLVFVLIMCMQMLTVSAFCAIDTKAVHRSGDYSYRFREDGTLMLVGYHGSSTTLTVPAKIAGVAVTAIGDEGYYMGNSMLENNVTELIIPETVKRIEYGTFSSGYYKSKLKKLTIHGGGLYIDAGAFSNSDVLESITIDGDVTLAGSVFSGCKALKSVVIGEGLREIPTHSFSSCKALEELVIPDSVRSIAYDALDGTPFVKADRYENGILYFGDHLIKVNGSVVTGDVVIKEGTRSVSENAFHSKLITSVTFPDSLEYIGMCAFDSCDNLKTLTLPSSLRYVGQSAFSGCDALESVTIEQGATGFEMRTFNYCKTLAQITIPSSLNTVPEAMLSGCTGLRKVIIEEGITEIESSAFRECKYLNDISIPYTVGKIGDEAFFDCIGLKRVSYSGSEAEWGKINISPNQNWRLNYAQFTYGECPVAAFKDMPKVTNWAHPGLRYCVAEGLMTGTSASTISPKTVTTRAQLVTLLWRLEGSPVTESKSNFVDLKKDWYREAVNWAAENGIVNGITETEFAPDEEITRQQMTAVIFRYSNFKGHNTEGRADISKYQDASKVQKYAREAFSWAVAEGIVTGSSDSKGKVSLDPLGSTTRSQCAAILMRYDKKYTAQ